MADNNPDPEQQPTASPAPPSREEIIKKKVSLGLTREQAEASTPFVSAPSAPDANVDYHAKIKAKVDAGLTPAEARQAVFNEATPEERRPIDIARRIAGGLSKEQATEAADLQVENDKAEAAKKKTADDAALELATRPDPKPKK
jgi:hypothetical protein